MSAPALPAVLQEIADVAGIDAAWTIARARGGTNVFLPRRVGPRHWLVGLVGLEAAQKICTHFRSDHREWVTIPLAAAHQAADRWREVLERDLSINEQALEMGAHVRTVSRHRARHAAERQDDLFGKRRGSGRH